MSRTIAAAQTVGGCFSFWVFRAKAGMFLILIVLCPHDIGALFSMPFYWRTILCAHSLSVLLLVQKYAGIELCYLEHLVLLESCLAQLLCHCYFDCGILILYFLEAFLIYVSSWKFMYLLPGTNWLESIYLSLCLYYNAQYIGCMHGSIWIIIKIL